ncbi:hypothetical protein [Streptomyces sp. SBT349]|uniref:hypothetical protein n=1 Tax=Streptomyces sp. SBT349 TaxID=1580539 RepID=UPI000AD9F4A7|nr:hypothetical protein [Streptomyces sp. SBT349]
MSADALDVGAYVRDTARGVEGTVERIAVYTVVIRRSDGSPHYADIDHIVVLRAARA